MKWLRLVRGGSLAIFGMTLFRNDPVEGYSFLATDGSRWPTSSMPIKFYVNPTNAPGGLSGAAQTAFAQWTNVSSSSISWSYGGSTAKTQSVWDDTCVVSWSADGDGFQPGDLAVTTISTNWFLTKDVDDADITVNGTERFSLSDDPFAYDLLGTLTHEAGHACGLGHSDDPWATMKQGAVKGSLHKRTLDLDDIAGASALYPAPSAKPQVQWTGPSTAIVGTPLYFTVTLKNNGDAPAGFVSLDISVKKTISTLSPTTSLQSWSSEWMSTSVTPAGGSPLWHRHAENLLPEVIPIDAKIAAQASSLPVGEVRSLTIKVTPMSEGVLRVLIRGTTDSIVSPTIGLEDQQGWPTEYYQISVSQPSSPPPLLPSIAWTSPPPPQSLTSGEVAVLSWIVADGIATHTDVHTHTLNPPWAGVGHVPVPSTGSGTFSTSWVAPWVSVPTKYFLGAHALFTSGEDTRTSILEVVVYPKTEAAPLDGDEGEESPVANSGGGGGGGGGCGSVGIDLLLIPLLLFLRRLRNRSNGRAVFPKEWTVLVAKESHR